MSTAQMTAMDEVFDRVREGISVWGTQVAEAGTTHFGVIKLEAWLEAQGYEKRVDKLKVIWTKKR
jgi:hypothetical protein